MILIGKWAEAVRKWAVLLPMVDRVYFIGSHVKGTADDDSDLDIAITMLLPFGYGDWFFHHDDWVHELQSRIDCPVHLLRGGGTLANKIVEDAIMDHGRLVYQRRNE